MLANSVLRVSSTPVAEKTVTTVEECPEMWGAERKWFMNVYRLAQRVREFR